jgi:beta-glucosidase
MSFPAGFLWGAGTSAHQVEGDNRANDWWVWESDPQSPSAGRSGRACEHLTRYPEDLDLLAGLGLNAYRFSLEWSRIEPEEGIVSVDALDHYRRVCDAARMRGMEPVITFHHFTTPMWVVKAGGWTTARTAELFARYVRRASAHLEGVFTYAITINEPNVVAAFGFELGFFPPGRREVAAKEQAAKTLIAAHHQARAAIRETVPGVRIGLGLSMNEWGCQPGCEDHMLAARAAMEDGYLAATAGDDFVGVQNYTRLHVGRDGIVGPPHGSRTTQTGFEFRPEALGVTVRRAVEVTGLPVMVSENGIATLDDGERIEYTGRALKSLEECVAGGAEVLGYLHWSALDGFEWVLGYWPKYGLIEVDLDTQVRRPRASGRWLGMVARANSVVTD